MMKIDGKTRRMAIATILSTVLLSSIPAQAGDVPRLPLDIAHRGGAGLAPENTLAAFRAGIEAGADGVELDVHLSRDGRLVVIHDPHVSRTTEGSGCVSDLDFADLKKLDASVRYTGPGAYGRQEVPSLEEVLDAVAGRIVTIQVEIKVKPDGSRYPGIEKKALEVLDRYGMKRKAVVLSFDYPTLRTVKDLDPAVPVCALVGTRQLRELGAGDSVAAAGSVAALGVEYAGVDERILTDELFASLRRAGLGVGVWTVNDEEKMLRFAGLGADFITTNRPDLLRKVLNRR